MIPDKMPMNTELFMQKIDNFSKSDKTIAGLSDFIAENLETLEVCMESAHHREKLGELSERIKKQFPENKEAAIISEKIGAFLYGNVFKIPEMRESILSYIPDREIYRNISSKLKNSSQVSKSFNQSASIEKRRWVQNELISLKTYAKSADQAVKYIIEHYLTKINFEDFPDFNGSHLDEILKHHEIEALKISEADISGWPRWPVMKSLKKFSFKSLKGDAYRLGVICPNVEEIECPKMPTDIFFREMIKALPALKKIEVRDLRFTGLANLSVVNLNTKELILDHSNITVDEILNLAKVFPNLEKLSLVYSKLNNNSLISLVKALPNLKYINLHGCDVTDESVALLIQLCPLLEQIKLRGTKVTGEGFPSVQNLNLKKISLSRHVTDKGLVKIAEFFPNLKEIEDIEKLITDQGINGLIHFCHDITRLNLRETSVTAEGLVGHKPNLIYLDFPEKVTDEGVIVMANVFPNLLEIHYSSKENLSDDGFIKFISSSPHLQKIDLSFSSLADKSILSIASCCPDLLEIQLKYTEVTESSVFVLAKSCRKLVLIDLDNSKVASSSLKELMKDYPELIVGYHGYNYYKNGINIKELSAYHGR